MTIQHFNETLEAAAVAVEQWDTNHRAFLRIHVASMLRSLKYIELAVPSSVAAPSPQNVLTYYGVFCNEEPYAAYPSRAQAEVYCSGFSKPCEIRTLSLAVPAPPSEPPATWQPIESAPRDGTRILSYQPNGAWKSARPWRGERIEVVYWHQPGNPEAEGMWVPSHRPTHWMPLPAPPSERTS